MSNVDSVDPLDRKFSPDDFKTKAVRGKYLAKASQGSNIVKLKPEIARMFASEEAVNQALASVIALARIPQQPKARKSSAKRAAA